MAAAHATLSRLKQIDTAKIMAPARPPPMDDIDRGAQLLSIKPHSGSGGLVPSPRNDSPAARIIDTEISPGGRKRKSGPAVASMCTLMMVKGPAPEARRRLDEIHVAHAGGDASRPPG